MSKTVYLSRTYTRKRYHLDRECRRLKPTSKIREVPVTHNSLMGLEPCGACLGREDPGGYSGTRIASKLEDMDADEIGGGA